MGARQTQAWYFWAWQVRCHPFLKSTLFRLSNRSPYPHPCTNIFYDDSSLFLQCVIQLLNHPWDQQMGITLMRHLPSPRYRLRIWKTTSRRSPSAFWATFIVNITTRWRQPEAKQIPNSYGSGSMNNYSQRFSNIYCVPGSVLNAYSRPWLPHPIE